MSCIAVAITQVTSEAFVKVLCDEDRPFGNFANSLLTSPLEDDDDEDEDLNEEFD